MAALEHVLILALSFVTLTNAESPCTRSRVLHHLMNCEDENLTTVPTGLPMDMETLDLRRNHIKTLLSNNFVNYSKLSNIYLSGNKVAEIHQDAFNGLTKLETLQLSDNFLRTFPCRALEELTALRTLKLDNNTIDLIPTNCTLPALTFIDLSNNNLQTLPESFCSFGETTKLSFDGNPWRCDDSLLPLLPCEQVSSRIKCTVPFNISGAILSTLSPNQLVHHADINVTITGRSTVLIGESVNLWCNVEGTLQGTLPWGKIQDADEKSFYREGHSLVLRDVSKADAGVYICEVSVGNTKAWGNVRLKVLAVETSFTTLQPTTVKPSEVTGTVATTKVPIAKTLTGKTAILITSIPEVNMTVQSRVAEGQDLGWQLIVIIFAAVFIALIVACLALMAWRKLRWGNNLQQYEGPIPIVVVDSPTPRDNSDGFFMEEEQLYEGEQYGSRQSVASYESYGNKHNNNGDDELSDEVDNPGSRGRLGVTRSIQDERYPKTQLEDEQEQLIDRSQSKERRSVESLRSGASSRTSRNSRRRNTRRRGEHDSRERVRKRPRDNADNVSASTQSSRLSTATRSSRGSRRSRRRQKPSSLVPDVLVTENEDNEGEDGVDGKAGTKKTIASERDLWSRWNPQRQSTSRRDVKSRAGGRAIATGRGAETFDLRNATPPEQAMNDSFELQDFSKTRPSKKQTSQRSLSDGKRSTRRPKRGREDDDSGKGSSKEI
ncbi:uncharacterized protein LOC118406954 [Branchiostoma floridae]|uniref:Uncharacterized protein LOC118406954 n=2 Tax=Branchiostoma floridae TaxID=7739 RepID=A0A9J7KAJ9_BRAFL|nr:uncharacterized protein LOC118406954 [Branchiostoma floridae]